jgi:hypothetical protein
MFWRSTENNNPTKQLTMKQPYYYLRQALAVCGASLILMQLSASAATLVSRYSFNETSGTNATDSVGGRTATLRGGTSFDGAGKVVLNGTNSYVNLGGGMFSGLTSATFEGWFSYSVPNNNVHLFSFDDGTGTGTQNGGAWNGNYMRYNINNGIAAVEIPNKGNPYNTGGAGDGKVAGATVLSQNTLHHVVFVYDSASGVESLYLDGVLDGTASGTVAPINTIFNIRGTLGASPWSAWGDPYLKGAISEFRVYSGVLSDSEIAANNAAGPDTIPQITPGVVQVSPTNNVYDGETVVLSCGVSGPVNGYHWEWDNGSYGASFVPISGATGLTYTQDTTGLSALSSQYQYQFVATNSSQSATSSVVTLTVNPATAPIVTVDTTPNYETRYTGGSVTFSAAFDGNHPITNQWQVSADYGSTWVDLPAQTNTTLTLTNLQLSDAGLYRLAATNAIGGNASSGATLVVNDISLAKYQWSAPVPFNGLNADQIMTNVSGAFVGCAAFGGTAYTVTLGNGRILNFTADGSIASATGVGTAAGAYPAGTGLTTSNANFDAVLNRFSYDGGPKSISVNGLTIGEQYSVQIFALDNRSLGGGESNRLANFQDPYDAVDVSATFKMGDNVYVIGTFTAANTTETIQMNLPTGNNGSLNALVLRALSYTPANQPPTITADPQSKAVFAGRSASFTVEASSYVLPGYQWQAGPSGGPFTNLNDGGVIVGATSNLLVLTNAAAYDGSQFQAVVSNPAGNTTSGAATLTVVPVPPTSGSAGLAVKSLSPVAYWPLNETNDPSTGLAGVYDAAGTFDGAYMAAAQNSFNGILGVQPADGFPMFVTNQGALKSTGNTDQSWVTTPPLNLNTNTVTIGMWIYPDGVQPSSVGLFVNRNSGTVAGLGYYDSDRLGYKWNNDAQSTWSFNSGLLIPTNVWSYVAVSVTPTNAVLYLYNTNGLQFTNNVVAHTNMTWGGSQANIRIGCDNTVARTFNGKIDEVAVFNRALTTAEIMQAAGAAVTLDAVRSGNQLQITWPYGTLLEATNLTGPWTTNMNASPYLVSPTGAQKFYRVQIP